MKNKGVVLRQIIKKHSGVPEVFLIRLFTKVFVENVREDVLSDEEVVNIMRYIIK